MSSKDTVIDSPADIVTIERIKTLMDQVLKKKPKDIKEFIDLTIDLDVVPFPYFKDGEMAGFSLSIANGKGKFSASKISPKLRWGALSKKVDYQEEQHAPILRQLAQKINSKSPLKTQSEFCFGVAAAAQTFESQESIPMEHIIEGTSAEDMVRDFKFSALPSMELLNHAFETYETALDEAGTSKGSSMLYLDQGATGTGKSHALAKGTAQYLKRAKGKKNVICVVPEKRHGVAIKEDLAKEMDVKNIQIIPRNSEAMVEYGIPTGCPLRGNAALKMDARINKLESLKYDYSEEKKKGVHAQKTTTDSLLDAIDSELRELRSGCLSWIKKSVEGQEAIQSKCTTCKGCMTMFPGAALFNNSSPAVSIITYDKLYFGLPSFEIKKKRARFFTYSAFVTEAGGGKTPFKNCIFLMEEYSQGHMKIVSRIEENAIKISLAETAKTIVRNFDSAFSGVCSRILVENPEVLQRFKSSVEEVRKKIEARCKEYYLHSKEYKPFATGDAKFNLFPARGTTLDRAIASMNPVFSSLFPKEQIGLRKEDISSAGLDSDTAMFSVKKFKHQWEMRGEDFSPATTASLMMQEKIIEPVTWMAAEFMRVTQWLPESNMDFSYIFLDEVTGKNREMMEFLSSLMQIRNSTKRLPLDEVSGASVLDDFYICGYEYLEARQINGDNIVDIFVRVARPSPEAMIDCMLSGGSNVVYISSASCTINSAITNFDLEWLRSRHGGNIRTLDEFEGQAILNEKTTEKVAPKVIWGGTSVNHPILNLNLDQERKSKSIPYMRAILEKFAASLLGDGNKALRSRVAIIFANSKKDVDAIMAAFNELIQERLEGKVYDIVASHKVYAESFAKGITEKIKADAAKQLLEHNGTQLTLIFTTYGSMTTGANFTLKFDEIPCREANFWAYVGNRPVRRHEGARGIDVDISDIVLVEKITNLVNEKNYIREGHHIAAMGTLDWGFLARNALAHNPKGPAINMSTAISKTPYLAAGMFDLIMQAIGRMDRTLNSSAQPSVFISSQFAKTFRDADKKVIGNTILPPAIVEAIRTAHEQIEVSNTCDREDLDEDLGLSSSEIYSFLANGIRTKDDFRAIWELSRDAFISGANELENLVIPSFEKHEILSDECGAYKFLGKIKRLISALNKVGLSLQHLMFEIPVEFVDLSGGVAQVAYEENGRQVRFYEPEKAPSQFVKNFPASYSEPGKIPKIKSFFIIKPAIFKEVIFPAKYEKEVKHITEKLCSRDVLDESAVGNHLIERSDLFIPECDACVDAKAWSIETMNSVADLKSMEALVKEARAKLRLMREEAPPGEWAPSRYIYGFRKWFNHLVNCGINSGAIYVKAGTDAELTNEDGDWDVAFTNIHSHYILHRTLNAIDINRVAK